MQRRCTTALWRYGRHSLPFLFRSSLLDKAIVITAIGIHGFDQTKCFTPKTNKRRANSSTQNNKRTDNRYGASRVIVTVLLRRRCQLHYFSHGFHGKSHDDQVIFWQREL